jgi:periplasmic divalent cation tolerance protein
MAPRYWGPSGGSVMTDKIIALSTCGSAEEAAQIARALVESRAAACVNVVAGVHSVYRWKGAIEEGSEWMLVIKTTRERLDRLRTQLRALHSYEVPELVVIPVIDGIEAYLNWISESVE